MKKSFAIVLAAIGVLLGVALGVNTNRYFAQRHEKTTAVMVLLQLHLGELETASSVKNCAQADSARHALQFMAAEIPVVLPLADQQDAVFHHHVQHLQQVLSSNSSMQCAADVSLVKQVRQACDECHRDYR
ncbi:MAG TPA: hypothetical protein VG962_07795 [Steroidobacteraceae bacterium]|nr:hypothetical protein [Steroidobacteraceae bacterium]